MICKCTHDVRNHITVIDADHNEYDYCNGCKEWYEDYLKRIYKQKRTWPPYHILEPDNLGYLERLVDEESK